MGEWRTLRKVVRLAGNAVGGWLFSSAPQQMSELRPIEDNWLTSFTSRDIISWLYLGVLFWFNESSVIQVELVLLCFDLLCFAGDALFFSPKLKVCVSAKLKPPASSGPVGTIFPTAFAHFLSLCHILVILALFQAFSWFCMLCWSGISDLLCHYWDSLKAQWCFQKWWLAFFSSWDF